jgi:hypothetical protein
MTDIDEEFLMSVYNDELQKKIISIVLEDIPNDEKIKKLAVYIREANR